MKPNRDTRTVTSTLVGEDVEMSLDLASTAHMMSIFTDMYEDPIMAITREYSTNGLDAQRAANFTGPIEITLPTALAATWRCRDFGDGLDAEDIRDIYSKYGASTKRATNDAVGMLGIGCKSALTYTDQFTVVGIKDGVKTIVSVSRNADGSGVMKVLEAAPTDEPSGVEIQVPAKRGDDFEKAARYFFGFWEAGTVKVNGKAPEALTGYALTDSLLVCENSLETDVIVMGNVPYPAKLELIEEGGRYDYRTHSRRAEKHIVARVPIGAVTFTPSREALMQTKTTGECIARIKDEFALAIKVAIERDVNKAPNKSAALQAYYTAEDALNLRGDVPTVKYKGEVVPDGVGFNRDMTIDGTANPAAFSAEAVRVEMRVLTGEPGSYRGSLSAYRSTDRLRGEDLAGTTIWIKQFLPEKFSSDQRRRIDAYREHKGIPKPSRFVLIRGDKLPSRDWIEDGIVWDWQELRKWRDPSAPAAATVAGKKVRGSYQTKRANNPGQHAWYPSEETSASELPTESDLYWLWSGRYGGKGQIEELAQHSSKAVLVLLPENRIKKFQRDFPHAMDANQALEAIKMHAAASLTDRQRGLLAWTPPVASTALDGLAASLLDDPELRQLITDRNEQKPLAQKHANHLDYMTTGTRIKTLTQDELIKRYPLLNELRSMGSRGTSDLPYYLNAAYAARKKENA